ncbi:hypothetical protein QCA50_014103 [Cerrena zonata]|uniref:DUF6534 domain-containing protein n=1 Tax=Cerrena zonata TaxID=2478898 RepID=A0AAW0G106_9APHY
MEAFPSVTDLVGGFIEGIGISNILFGISIAQAYVYMQNWERDPKWMKWLAVSVMLLETMNTVFVQRQQYFYSVLAISDPFLLVEIDWSIPAALIFEVVSEIVVQSFYVHRMWIFSRNIALTTGTSILLLCRYGFYINCIVDTIKYKTWPELHAAMGFKPSFIATASVIIFTDTVIASTMAFYLYRKKSSIRKTRGIMTWLMVYFVNTGAILVALSTTSLITFLVTPNSLLFGATILLYARALANALFGALNARLLLRTKRNETVTFGGTSISGNIGSYPHELQKVQVRVEHDTMVIGHPNESVAGSDTAFKSSQSLNSGQAKV